MFKMFSISEIKLKKMHLERITEDEDKKDDDQQVFRL